MYVNNNQDASVDWKMPLGWLWISQHAATKLWDCLPWQLI